MFKLPKCPHCNTVYRYKDTKEAMAKKENTCYHCKKDFVAKKFPQMIVLIVIILAICIAFNILLLNNMKSLNILVMLIPTIIFLVIGYFLIPFFVGFKKKDNSRK